MASAARLRHVFMVLAGAGLAAFYSYCWSAFGIEPVGAPGDVALGVVLVLGVPAAIALAVAALAVALTASRHQGIYLVSGLAVTLMPVVFGVVLARAADVHSVRRMNTSWYFVMLSEYTGAWDRPMRERMWGRRASRGSDRPRDTVAARANM